MDLPDMSLETRSPELPEGVSLASPAGRTSALSPLEIKLRVPAAAAAPSKAMPGRRRAPPLAARPPAAALALPLSAAQQLDRAASRQGPRPPEEEEEEYQYHAWFARYDFSEAVMEGIKVIANLGSAGGHLARLPGTAMDNLLFLGERRSALRRHPPTAGLRNCARLRTSANVYGLLRPPATASRRQQRQVAVELTPGCPRLSLDASLR